MSNTPEQLADRLEQTLSMSMFARSSDLYAQLASNRDEAAAELRRLAAENAELKADAERYRFIRDVPYTDYIYNVMTHQKNGVMDAAIDAAMKKETP